MSISILVEAKKILVKENAASRLMNLLSDKNDNVVLNVIKVFLSINTLQTITNCAEDYRGRFQLNPCLQTVISSTLMISWKI
jgi:hypothetical protein